MDTGFNRELDHYTLNVNVIIGKGGMKQKVWRLWNKCSHNVPNPQIHSCSLQTCPRAAARRSSISKWWEANTAKQNMRPNNRKQQHSFAQSLYCDNLSGSNLEIMNYISHKSRSLLISGTGTRFVVYETCKNGVITLYKSIRALQLCTMCFAKQIKWCLW